MKSTLLIYLLIGTCLQLSYSRTLHFRGNVREAIRQDGERGFKTFLFKQLPERDFTCPAVEGVYPADDQCSGDYYLCVDGVPYIQHCAGELVYDPSKERCVSKGESSCVPGSPVTSTPSTSTSSTSTPSTSTPSTVTASTTSTYADWTSTTSSTSSTTARTTTRPSGGTFDCPSPNGNFPIPDTCGSDYYVCIANFSYSVSCPNEQIFDPNLLKCVPADQASCNPVFVCPIEDGFFPIPGVSCSGSYYLCIAGEPHITNCPDGLIFDPSQVECLPSDQVSC